MLSRLDTGLAPPWHCALVTVLLPCCWLLLLLLLCLGCLAGRLLRLLRRLPVLVSVHSQLLPLRSWSPSSSHGWLLPAPITAHHLVT